MKKTIKLIPAIVMLLVSAILVSTSTYAWFSMNTKVNVTGMEIKAVVQDNLLIAKATSGAADTDGELETAYQKALTDRIVAILEPASTVDGVKYYYTATDNVVGSGDAITDNYISYTNYASETVYGTQEGASGYTDKFSQNYGVSAEKAGALFSGVDKAEAFKDYAFYIKATNTAGSDKEVRISKLDLTYGAATQAQKAFRVAVFVDAMTDATTGAHAVESMPLKSIVKPTGATNFTENSAVKNNTTVAEISSSVRDQALVLGSVGVGTTKYFKVVVRIWLEGEDNTCNNDTFATLTDTWALDLECTMDGSSAAVNSLTQRQTSPKIDLSAAPSATDNAGTNVVIDSTTYYKIGDTSYYTTTVGAVTSATRVFSIVDNHPYDVTNQCTLPTT